MDEIKESTVQQIYAELGEEEGNKVLEKMKESPYKNLVIQFKPMFPLLTEKELDNILAKNKGDTETAFDEFLALNNKKEEEFQRAKMEKAQKARLQENNKRIEELMQQFLSLPKQKIVEIFNKNSNDTQKTANALTMLLEQQERENKEILEKEEKAMKEKTRTALIERFPNLTREEICEELEKTNYSKDKSFPVLTKKSRQRTLWALKAEFTLLTNEELKECAKKANWNHADTYKLCKEIQKKKDLEKKEKEQVKVTVKQEEFLLLDEKDDEDIQRASIVIINHLDNENKHEGVNEALKQQVQNKLIDILKPSEEIPQNNNNNVNNSEGAIKPQIEVTKEEGKLKAKVTLLGATSYSWVGFFKKDSNDKTYLTYNYLCYLPDNTLVCDIPKLNGDYEFRAFISSDKKVVTSETLNFDKKDELNFTVQEEENKVTVDWKIFSFDPTNAYVTVHFSNEQRPNYYRRWDWLRTNEGSVRFKKLVHAGEYEARVYIGGVLQFKSNPLKINGI